MRIFAQIFPNKLFFIYFFRFFLYFLNEFGKMFAKIFYLVYTKLYRKEKYMNEQIEEIYASVKEDLEKAFNHQQNEYQVIRAGRANPHILDKVYVEYYGVSTPINQMGTVTVSEGRILTINVWDASQLKNVEKAISASDIGITPIDDGKVIRLAFPIPTEERRREIVKQVKKICEETKIVMRNARRDALDMLKDLKKDGLISEDEFSACEKEVQKFVDKYSALADKEAEDKEAEVMKV